MFNRKPKNSVIGIFQDKPQPIEKTDYRETFRFGKFDDSGYVNEMHESNSLQEFASLEIDVRTKPFKFPLEEIGYIDVYLCGTEPLKKEFSYDSIWLSADLCYTNFELAGSMIGKLSEIYQRVGEIKSSLSDEFSLKANLFLVIMCILGGIGLFYTVGRFFFGH